MLNGRKDVIYFSFSPKMVCGTICLTSSSPGLSWRNRLPLFLLSLCMSGHFLCEYNQLLFTPLSSHYCACYLCLAWAAAQPCSFISLSPADRVINHSLKYGVNCRKPQITIFIGHSRTNPRRSLLAYRCSMHGGNQSQKSVPERLWEDISWCYEMWCQIHNSYIVTQKIWFRNLPGIHY